MGVVVSPSGMPWPHHGSFHPSMPSPSIGFGFLDIIVIFWRLRAPPFFEFGLIPVPMLDRCVEDSIQKSTPPAATSKHAWPTTDRQTNKLSLFTNWSVRLMRYKIQWDMEFVCPTDRQTNCAVYIVSSTTDRRI